MTASTLSIVMFYEGRAGSVFNELFKKVKISWGVIKYFQILFKSISTIIINCFSYKTLYFLQKCPF